MRWSGRRNREQPKADMTATIEERSLPYEAGGPPASSVPAEAARMDALHQGRMSRGTHHAFAQIVAIETLIARIAHLGDDY